MEQKPEQTPGQEGEVSVIEAARAEGFDAVLHRIGERVPHSLRSYYESNERTYGLESGEDCLVAESQQLLEILQAELTEARARADGGREAYFQEGALAKLTGLMEEHVSLMSKYAELKKYYPEAATHMEEWLPPLGCAGEHGDKLWTKIREAK